MLTNEVRALTGLCESLIEEEIVDRFVLNGMLQTENQPEIRFLDEMITEYCKNANKILTLAKTKLESEDPRYALIDKMLEKLEADSLRVAAKKVGDSILPVRICLTGDPEDLDVAKSALGTLEREYRVFESNIRKFIELKKEVHLDRTAPARSQAEISKKRKGKGKMY